MKHEWKIKNLNVEIAVAEAKLLQTVNIEKLKNTLLLHQIADAL